MSHTACALVLAFALVPVTATTQGRGKAKGTEKQPTTVEQSTPKAQTPQGKGKAKKADPAAPSGTTGTQGAGSCAPDTTQPVIHAVNTAPKVLWSPNHRMVPVSITANVTDNCPGVTWSVTSIASDEAVNGTGEGDTEPDWAISSAHAVNLRAERAGAGDGRVYTITITARDAANNTATATTTVSVPHSQK